MRRPWARRAGLLALLTVACAAAPAGAVASRASIPDNQGRLALASQDAWTPLGGTFHASVQVSPGSAEQLLVIAHQPLTSRSAFERAVADQDLGGVLSTVPIGVDTLTSSADGTKQVAIGLAAPNGPVDPSRLAVPRAGVYPLEVELRDAQANPLSRFVTFLVAVDPAFGGGGTPLTRKLGVAWVWPLATRPAVDPNGVTAPSVSAALEPTGRLGAAAAELNRQPGVPVTMAPSPDTLDAWSTLARTDPGAAAGVSELRAAQSRDQVVAGPYVPIDLPQLLRSGLGSAADAQYVQGSAAIDRFFGTHVDERTALALPVDADAVGRLRARGVTQLVVDESAVGAIGGRFTTAASFSVAPSPSLAPTGPVSAVADDVRLGSLLTGSEPAALRAQRFLAGLSLTALEQPGVTRAVVVVNPDSFDSSPAVLDAVLSGLSAHPWLSPLTLDQAFSSVQGSPNGVRPLASYTPPPLAVSAHGYTAAETRLGSFSALVGPNDPRVQRAGRFLLSSVSSSWTGPGAAQEARLELTAVNATIDTFLARIRVPAPGTITLTARSGAIPITFRNDTGQPVRVSVTLSSHKLDFPQGAVQTISLPPRATTIRIDVRSRTSGTFPLVMSVRSADGSLVIAEGRFKVRSTVVSTVGLALAVGAAVFLAAWWLYVIRRRRQARAGATT